MTPRKSLLLSFGLALLCGQTLQAQVTEANANPAHEKIKSEAESFYKQGKYQQTIDLTSQVITQNPKDDVAHYLRGSAKVEMGIRSNNTEMVRQGIADAREAIGLNGQEHTDYYLPYLYGMSNLSQLEGRKEHAEVALQVATQVLNLANVKEDQKANVLYHKARTQTLLGKHAEAAQDFEQALKFNSMHMGAFLGAAHAYAAAGDFAKAEQQFTKGISTFPNNPVVYNDRGMFRQQRKQFDQALADFTRVIELKKDAYYAYTNRGFTLMEQGDPQAAESDFDRSLNLLPNQAMVHSFRGTARLAQGKLAEATADYQKVANLIPTIRSPRRIWDSRSSSRKTMRLPPSNSKPRPKPTRNSSTSIPGIWSPSASLNRRRTTNRNSPRCSKRIRKRRTGPIWSWAISSAESPRSNSWPGPTATMPRSRRLRSAKRISSSASKWPWRGTPKPPLKTSAKRRKPKCRICRRIAVRRWPSKS